MVQPITRLIKEANRGKEITFDDKCIKAVQTVQNAVGALPCLHHLNCELVKELYIVIGEIAFASVMYQVQIQPKPEKQPLEFFSRKWPLDVTNYHEYDRYALAIRTAIQHLRPWLVAAPVFIIYTNNNGFNTLATRMDNWTPRMQRFLAETFIFSPIYRKPPSQHCKELDALHNPIPSNELQEIYKEKQEGETITTPSESVFPELTMIEKQRVPTVNTDGGCRWVASELSDEGRVRVGTVGVYSGEDSPLNLSALAKYPPFTNQRAELEAILCALEQAIKLKMAYLFIRSDSSYAVSSLMVYQKKWIKHISIDGEEHMMYDTKGQEISNGDLFWLLSEAMHKVQVHLIHIPRAENSQADALATQALSLQAPLTSAMVSLITAAAAAVNTSNHSKVHHQVESLSNFSSSSVYVLLSEDEDQESSVNSINPFPSNSSQSNLDVVISDGSDDDQSEMLEEEIDNQSVLSLKSEDSLDINEYDDYKNRENQNAGGEMPIIAEGDGPMQWTLDAQIKQIRKQHNPLILRVKGLLWLIC